MTALLSIITFCLIVLIVLAGIGVFNLRCICNYCDFIHTEQYHHQGILNSIQSVVSNVLINQDTALNHSEAIADDVENIKLYFAPPECPDDLPFPEDEGKDEPTPEDDGFGRGKYEPFEMSDNTTLDDIIDAFKNRRIAVHCASEDEFNLMLTIFDSYELKTLTKESPLVLKRGYKRGNDAFGYIEKSIDNPIAILMDIIAGGTKGVSMGRVDEYAKGDYCIINFSEFAHLIPTAQFDDAPAEQTDEPVVENAGAILRDIRDEKLANGDYVDCSETTAETPEKAAEEIPAPPVESDTTEDKGEADA